MRDELMADPLVIDPGDALARHLTSENEVLRSAALRALIAVCPDADRLRRTLADALLDPDPDVRCDAMEAFANLARPEDTGILLRSLEGDPVREVKLAAIAGLARTTEPTAQDVLRQLVASRCDDRIAWEDELSDWEDWLDVQVAAIAALGEMGCTDAIPDILAARDDEMAQTLDLPVFEALGKMGQEGVSWLLAVVQTDGVLAQKRAAECLSRVAPDCLADHLEALLGHKDEVLRALAVTLVPEDNAVLSEMARSDASAKVRLAALCRGAVARPSIAVDALRDVSSDVQAAALERLPATLDPGLQAALVDNLMLWLSKGAPILMCAAARHLAEYAPDRACEALTLLAQDDQRPLDARVAAVHALAQLRPKVPTDLLSDMVASPAQQVRMSALVALRDRAEHGDDAALVCLVRAIESDLLTPDQAVHIPSVQSGAQDLGVAKGDAPGSGRIRITRDGEIVRQDVTHPAADDGGSTLQSILAPLEAPALAEDTPEESGAKRRKRRAVEGPDDIAGSLSLDSMGVCARLASTRIGAALLNRAVDGPTECQPSAWSALAEHLVAHPGDDRYATAARIAWRSEIPAVRLAAFRILSASGAVGDVLLSAVEDPDALVRADAVAHLPANQALAHIADDARVVRQVAVRHLCADVSVDVLQDAIDRLVAAQFQDSLTDLFAGSPPARSLALARVSNNTDKGTHLLVLLLALASCPSVMS